MSHNRYPILRVLPPYFVNENELQEIIELLEEEKYLKLKNWDSFTTSKLYDVIIQFHQEWDEPEEETYWIKRYYENHPDEILSRLYYINNTIEKLADFKDLDIVERLFAEEIACLIHDKEMAVIIHDEELRLLILFLTQFFMANGKMDEVKKLYQVAKGLKFGELARDLSFFIRGEERINYYLDEEYEENIVWSQRVLNLIKESKLNLNFKVAPPKQLGSYMLLNKSIYDWTPGDLSELLTVEVTEDFDHELSTVFCHGVLRLMRSTILPDFNFIYATLFLAAHHRRYGLLKLIQEVMAIMPTELFEEMVGDIGMELLQQPFSVLAAYEPESFLEVIRDSRLRNFHKSTFYDILCYTYRLTGKDSVKRVIDQIWNYALKYNMELIGHLINCIVDHEVEGYEKAIEKAYEQDLVDLRYFDRLEDLEVMTDMRSFDAESIDATDLKSMQQNLISAFNKVNPNSPQNLEGDIDATMAEAKRYDEMRMRETEEFNEAIEDDFDLYDEFYSKGFIPMPETVVRQGAKVGRNDPCPCGSGKKYKRCCLSMN